MTYQTVQTQAAPPAIGPYSQAIEAAGILFCSGQLGMDPQTGELVEGGAAEQTGRALANLAGVLDAAGLTLGDVAKTTVFLSSLSDFASMNEVYAGFFGALRPARSTIEVAGLPKGAAVEIEAVAVRPERPPVTARP